MLRVCPSIYRSSGVVALTSTPGTSHAEVSTSAADRVPGQDIGTLYAGAAARDVAREQAQRPEWDNRDDRDTTRETLLNGEPLCAAGAS